jgi:hypothetical protein
LGKPKRVDLTLTKAAIYTPLAVLRSEANAKRKVDLRKFMETETGKSYPITPHFGAAWRIQ